METNTVLLSIEKYEEFKSAANELSELKNKPEPELTHTIEIVYRSGIYHQYSRTVKTNETAVKSLSESLKEANDKINELNSTIEDLPKKKTIQDVKKMSWREFRAWKKTE